MDQATKLPDAVATALVGEGLASEVVGMTRAFWASPERNKLLTLAAALVAVVGTTAFMQILLNAWNQPFYDALAHKNLPAFVEQLGVFAKLAGVLLVLNVAQMWLNRSTKVTLREGLVLDLLNEWLLPLRAFRLSNAGEIGANPDQRIHEDAQHLTELTTDLGIGLLQSSLLLLSFIGVLWGLSNRMVLWIGSSSFILPGYMVWCALFYAGAASYFSWRVGRPLIKLNAERYAREAELRSSLVRVNEQIDGVALYGGEADEKQRLGVIFETVLAVMRRLVGSVTRLTWVTAGYGWFTIVAPILVASPAYFRGDISFGELMMMVGAFNQVQQALRWFVDNFSSIADWRATLLRVATFRNAILTMDDLGKTESRIDFKESEDQSVLVEDLHVAAPVGCVMLSEKHVALKPGERVFVVSESGTSKTLVFRAISGLWPWGSGSITHPARQTVMFMPNHAYVPPGTLRAAVTYPDAITVYEDAAVIAALARVGLGRLGPQLDQSGRWDKTLSEDEKQCLAFARVILQKPHWVVFDEALGALDRVSRERIEAIFTGELADMGVVNIGKSKVWSGFFGRTLRIVTDPQGPAFRPAYRSSDHGGTVSAREAALAK